MGDFSIVIRGTGSHHNELKNDADEMASEFVDRLREAGHGIAYAEFVQGSAETLPKLRDDPGTR